MTKNRLNTVIESGKANPLRANPQPDTRLIVFAHSAPDIDIGRIREWEHKECAQLNGDNLVVGGRDGGRTRRGGGHRDIRVGAAADHGRLHLGDVRLGVLAGERNGVGAASLTLDSHIIGGDALQPHQGGLHLRRGGGMGDRRSRLATEA
ncbi:hypothetical protein LV35_04258 [Acinetobacter baumannii]|uniref:Uncharacterized protein n=1 Tax=Acinetobacter baumannii TaxID=470 RepID=A0AAJ0QS94_ACIBA|nr:hypothetical protein LV35_04258 [Acinetobacter baumannii]